MDRIKTTPLGTWLAKVAPDVLKAVGGLVAEKAVWPLIRSLLNRRRLSAADMEHAKTLADASLKNVRADLWHLDTMQGSWLAKNARPLMTFTSMAGALAVTILEGTGNHVGDMWQGVWATLCISTVGAYFAVQTLNDGRSKGANRQRIRRKLDRRSSA